MAFSQDEFLGLADYFDGQPGAQRNGAHGKPQETREQTKIERAWDALFMSDHPKGGGPFGGINNALTALCGCFRAKRIPFEAAIEIALLWNQSKCSPPADEAFVRDRIARAWAEWVEGDQEELTPDDLKAKPEDKPLKQEWEILTAQQLLDHKASTGGTQWLVPDVFVQGGLHFVSAPSGVAKSWILLDLARCVSTGAPWMGKYDVPQGGVIYIDEEMGARDASDRAGKLCYPGDAEFLYIGKQGFRIFDAADRKRLADLCRTNNTSLVCFDTMAAIWPGLKENESAQVTLLRAFFEEIRAASGATLVVAHHDKKNTADELSRQNRMAGSRDFAAMADMTYSIEKNKDFFHMEFAKNRHLPDDKALSMDFDIHDSEDRSKVTLRILEAEDVSNRKVDAMGQRVIAVLQDGPLGTNTLVERVGGMKSVVIAAAQKLLASGQLDCTEGPRGARVYFIAGS